MKRAGIRRIGGTAAVALSTAFAASCSTPPQIPPAPSPRAVHPTHVATGQIAQVDFGRRATFAKCLPPACPAVTPKTLAVEDRQRPATPRPMEPMVSLAEGESFVIADAASAPPAVPVAKPSAAAPKDALPRQVVVHFAFGDALLSAAARSLIDQAARPLSSARRIAISGRTDSVGPQLSNQSLALARANAVRDHLRTRYPHLAPTLTLDAQGACCFAASNDTPQGRALNRRVEVIFERDTEDL